MKLCRGCNAEKDEGEFYGHSASGGLKGECKSCTKLRVGKWQSRKAGKEYQTAGEWRETIAERKAKRLERIAEERKAAGILSQEERRIWMESDEGKWARALGAALSRHNSRSAARLKSSDPWYRRLDGIASGIRSSREQLQRKRQSRIKSERGGGWMANLQRAIERHKSRKAVRLMLADPWYRKLSSMATNWRRKKAGRSTSQP